MSERHEHGEVTFEVIDDHVALITVDRSEKRNGFTPKMLHELAAAMTRLDEDPSLFCGVLAFAGADTTAGLDMPMFFGPDADPRALRTEGVDPLGLGRRLTKPQITAVQGITYTIGIELALAGDIVVAADDTRFCQLEPKRGLVAVGGATLRFATRGGWGNAMYHLLRADEFGADEAHRIGLAQEVVPTGTQIDRAIELALEVAANAPLAIMATKANARVALDHGEAAAIAEFPAIVATLEASDDLAEGIASFLERRPARFEGR